MAGIVLEIDPLSEDAANANLVIVDNTTYFLMEGYNDDPNPWDVMRVSSADTEGELAVQNRPTNRTVTVPLRVVGASASAVETTVYGLQQKVGKLVREGGTLKKTTPSGDTVVFDVVSATIITAADRGYVVGPRATVTLTFECKPYARGPVVQLADHVETTLPVAIGVDTAVGGDAPALVRILIDEDQAANQWWVVWGTQSRYYDSATSAALFYEAEGRTALSGSTVVTQTGASGGGTNNAVEATLDTEWLAFLSTQATAAGAHLSHIGNYRVFARVLTPTANTGAVSVAFQWGEGDFVSATTTNPQIDFLVDAWDNSFRLLDLGQIHLSKAAAGTQRWEGRIIAKSTVAGDKLRIDHLFLVPIDEGSGEASGIVRSQTPASFTGLDSFTATTAGNALNARVAPVGGTWATSGDATDFVFADDSGGEQIKRTTSAAGTTGRFAILGAATPALVEVQTSCIVLTPSNLQPGTFQNMGVIARWVDSSNYLRAYVLRWFDPAYGVRSFLRIEQLVAGVGTIIGNVAGILTTGSSDIWFTVNLRVTVEGQATATLSYADTNTVIAAASGTNAALATGGALASGKSGLYDFTDTTGLEVRYYDDFRVFAPVTDAAIFASQSLELRSDRVVREDSGGTLWQRPSSYEGDYPTFPPAGKEARSVRTIVKACRNDPVTGADSAIDDLSFRATVTPRYLQIPA